MRHRLLVAVLALLPVVVMAQSGPHWPLDYVPGVQEWENWWESKADANNPRINTGSLVYNVHPFGTFNTACGLGLIANDPTGMGQCQVLGYNPGPAAYGAYPAVDNVALYVSNTGNPPLFTVSAVTYSATQALFSPALTSGQMAQLKPGLHIRTTAGFLSQIASIDPSGNSITTYGWAQSGNTAPGQIPAANDPLSFGVVDKVFGANVVMGLLPGGPQQGVATEFDNINNNNAPPANNWGVDSIELGTYPGGSAFISRGPWATGYRAQTGSVAGFLFDPPNASSVPTGVAFESLDISYLTAPDAAAHDFASLAPAGGSPSYRVTDTGKTITNQMSVNGNLNGTAPAIAGNTMIGWNYAGGESDYFNASASATNADAWWQWTGTAWVRVAYLTASGQFTAAQGVSGSLTVPPVAAGNNQPSGAVQLNSVSSGGASQQGYITLDASGNIILNPNTGQVRPTSFAIPLGAPVSGTATCVPGQNLQSGSYLYSCLSANRWGRLAWDISW